jgi:aryl-alcohol dehydrogenase-like predicted oxidoreductase
MDYRFLGRSGLQVSTLSFGTMTFGGGEYFKHMGNSQVEEARRLVEVCLEAGITLFDTADVYSQGGSEEVLGAAIGRGRRDRVLIATKAFARMGPGQHDAGNSRQHLVKACENSLRRLGTDYIDLYQVHGFDSLAPVEETLSALDQLIRQGKVRYLGCSNFSGWHLMKSLAVAERFGMERFVSQQVYYTLLARELEYELIPLGLDQQVGILVWSPLSFGLLSGKYRRDTPKPDDTRLAQLEPPGTVDWERLYRIVDVLDEIAQARGKSVPQVTLNWLLRRPGITSLILGARNEAQLRDNLGAVGWSLTEAEVRRLETASDFPEIYPYWHQHKWGLERNPRVARNYQP